MNDLNYYKNLLQDSVNKKLICTNPDLVVDRGNNQEYCAGTVAKIFENIGGKTIYFGKPYKDIYDLIIRDNKKALIIGDNLRTDIKGANSMNQDSLFILDGIHKKEINNINNISDLLKKYNVETDFIQNQLNW